MVTSKPKKARLGTEERKLLSKDLPSALGELTSLLTVLDEFGIVATYDELSHADAQPEACIRRTNKRLQVMAYHGGKWLEESWLEENLRRLKQRDGRVQFLLSNTIRQELLERAKMLKQTFPGVFDLRLFGSRSIFRAVMIDDKEMLLGHYGHDFIEGKKDNEFGWQSPQLCVEDNGTWSLMVPFRQVFRDIWNTAESVSDIDTTWPGPKITRDFEPLEDNSG